jgi:hypothetical protein
VVHSPDHLIEISAKIKSTSIVYYTN